MLNLYWKTESQTRNLISKPFGSESEFEKYVFENQELLGDVYIIHRQIRTGSREGIPDMIGVDQDARICIIEMKNIEVSEDILPQVLGYAIWADTNPDSIKAIWLEAKHKPEDIEIEWDNLEVRVIVIAPDFRATVPRMAGKIGYPIDLIQIQRFGFEDEEFLLVDVLAEKPSPKVGTTKVMEEWDWDFYEREHGKEATQHFRKAVEAIAAFVEKQGWDLPYNLNKYYTGFKLGNRVVIGVYWGGTHAWNVGIKIPKESAEDFAGSDWEFQRYDSDFNNAVFRPKDWKAQEIHELEPLMIAAYKYISGTK
jgi:hypothetical protein